MFWNFSFRKIVLPQINLVLKTFGDSTTDCVTEKILTQYLLKCKLSLVNSTHACIFMINLLTKRALICLLDHSNYVKLLSTVLRSATTLWAILTQLLAVLDLNHYSSAYMKDHIWTEWDSTHDLCDTGVVLYQLSFQANWELVTLWVHNIPVDVEDTSEYMKGHILFWTAEMDMKTLILQLRTQLERSWIWISFKPEIFSGFRFTTAY